MYQTAFDTMSNEWISLSPNELSMQQADSGGIIEGWFKLRFEVDSSLTRRPLRLFLNGFGAADVYLNDALVAEFGNTSESRHEYRAMVSGFRGMTSVSFEPGSVYNLTIHYRDTGYRLYEKLTLKSRHPQLLVLLTDEAMYAADLVSYSEYAFFAGVWLTGVTLLTLLFALFFYQNSQLTSLKLIAISTAVLATSAWLERVQMNLGGFANWVAEYFYYQLMALFVGLVPMVISYLIRGRLTRVTWSILIIVTLSAPILAYLYDIPRANYGGYYMMGAVLALVFGYSFMVVLQARHSLAPSQKVVVAGLVITLLWMIMHTLFISMGAFSNYYRLFTVAMIYLSLPVSFLGYISIKFNENLVTVQRNLKEISELTDQKLRVQAEKQELIESQNIVLELQVRERTSELTERNQELVLARDNLQQAIEDLKSTQEQLIQQEKLASLGQLTAGIAHEIKNPLNFVNNFSHVSIELVNELKEALETSDIDEAKWIAGDLGSNMERIYEHGSRADGIVKAMLMHSRNGSGKKEPAALNSIVKEYVNLAYHGMRAAENPIRVDVLEDYDPLVGDVPLVAEDFSRVILNICNNAFDALRGNGGGTARLFVRTRRDGHKVLLEFEDNGPGIPYDIKDKILQPFFTTKRGTQGTGLGLSITHDIIKAHGGELQVSSEPGKTIFSIVLLSDSTNHEDQ